MTDSSVIDIGVQSILLAAKLAAPVLGVSLCVGLLIGLLQSATQIQEQTLALVICGHWMLDQMVSFTTNLWAMIPHLIQ
jgi:flagellar biosynthetic protein FliQ